MSSPMVYLYGITLDQIHKFADLISFKVLDLNTNQPYNEHLCISYIDDFSQWQKLQGLDIGLHMVIASPHLLEDEIAQLKDVLLYRQSKDEDLQTCLDLILRSLIIYQRQDQFECTQLDFSDLKHLAFNTPQGLGIVRYALDDILEQHYQLPNDFHPQDSDQDATVLTMTLPKENTFKITREIIKNLFNDNDIGNNHQIFYALRLSNDEILNGQHNDQVYFIYRKSA